MKFKKKMLTVLMILISLLKTVLKMTYLWIVGYLLINILIGFQYPNLLEGLVILSFFKIIIHVLHSDNKKSI